MIDFAAVIQALPCTHCAEPTVVFVMDMAGDRPIERLCETHWRDRVAVEEEHRL